MVPARMLLDLLKAPDLCMVCYGNVSSMRHIYGKSFDNTSEVIPRGNYLGPPGCEPRTPA